MIRDTLELNASTEKETVWELITPEIALAYLKLNDPHNRGIKPSSVENFARMIRRGEFKTTHQGIAFLQDGHLGDGQHRMFGVVRAGEPVKIQVTRGMTREELMAVDQGAKRTIKDVLTISEPVDPDTNDAMNNQKIISALTQLVNVGYKRMQLSSFDLKRLYDMFEEQAVFLYENIVTRKYANNCTAAVFAASIAALYCGVHKDVIKKFFDVYSSADISGCDDLNVQAALNWRHQVDSMKARHASIDKTKMYLSVQNAIWNFANNTNVSTIKTPAKPRYDVRIQISNALGITEDEAA